MTNMFFNNEKYISRSHFRAKSFSGQSFRTSLNYNFAPKAVLNDEGNDDDVLMLMLVIILMMVIVMNMVMIVMMIVILMIVRMMMIVIYIVIYNDCYFDDSEDAEQYLLLAHLNSVGRESPPSVEAAAIKAKHLKQKSDILVYKGKAAKEI